MSVRLERKTFERKTPEYDYRSRDWHWSPEKIRSSFKNFPLGRKYVDWLSSENYQIESRKLDNAKGYVLFGEREIWIRNDLSVGEQKLTVCHELIHIAVPQLTRLITNKGIEDAIDDVARPLSRNDVFMDYLFSKVPYFCRVPQKNPVFPTWPISDKYNIIFEDSNS